MSATLTEARTHLQTLNPELVAARAVVEHQVGAAASALVTAEQTISSAGRLGRGRAQHRFNRLASHYSEQLGVLVTGG